MTAEIPSAIKLRLQSILSFFEVNIAALKAFAVNVAGMYIGKADNRSANAPPTAAAPTAYGAGKSEAAIKISVSPRCTYPNPPGIGNDTYAVHTQTRAAKTAE